MDTNHKLIRWNFIIAGGIDGFSRLVTFLKCTDNNTAATLLECFQKGVQEYGVPLRVRSDKGLENTLIADYMIRARGGNRGSMLTGKSTHNQRIERLWRDVYEGVLSYYYDLFRYMEDIDILDHLSEVHMKALHHVYLHRINEKLGIWRSAWANHKVRTMGSTPLQIYTMGTINNHDQHVDDVAADDAAFSEGEENRDDNARPIFNALQMNIAELCQQELNRRCPKNWESNDYGMDVYKLAVEVINQYQH